MHAAPFYMYGVEFYIYAQKFYKWAQKCKGGGSRDATDHLPIAYKRRTFWGFPVSLSFSPLPSRSSLLVACTFAIHTSFLLV